MANEFIQQEGLAITQLEIRVSDTETIPILGQTATLTGAEITETCENICRARFVVQCATRDYVDKLLRQAQAGATPKVRWRIGIGFPEGVTEWIPWQNHIIVNSGSALEGLGASSGYTTIIETADALWEIDRINTVKSRKGKISDIVREIAESYKFPHVIEPTKTNGLYYQSYTSDYEFIRRRMVPRALNDKNRGNYQFYVRDGTFHFHTIDYQASLKDFVYYASTGTKLSVHDYTQSSIKLGSSGVAVIYYDPYTGSFGAVKSDPSQTLRLSNTSPDVIKSLPGAARNIMFTIGSNRDIDPDSIASNVFESSKSGVYALKLTVPRTLFFRANDICRITIQPDKDQVPPSSGTYQVSKIAMIVDKTSLISEITLKRGEFLTKEKTHTSLENAGESVVQPYRGAVGQDPNFKSVASSIITKGSGKQVSRTVVVDTLSPYSAPNPQT